MSGARTLPTSSEYALETNGLRKAFGSRLAVRDLSIAVRRGEIFGFLGPNGAGKSTSIKMLLGLVTPTGGHATVLGAPAGDVETRRKIGFLPEDFRFYDWLTASEVLHLHGRLCGMSDAKRNARVPEVIDLVGLAPHADRRLKGFSKGMLQRIGLAQALVHEPEIIFLDEPTSGLDPMGRRMVRDILRAQRERGVTVFLNSHLLSEIEITCDRVVFIREGEVAASQDLTPSAARETRVVMRAGNLSGPAVAAIAPWTVGPARLDGDELTFTVASNDDISAVVRHLVRAGADVFSVMPGHESLEDLFMNIMGEDRGL